jgi:hypothetical protein
MPPNGFGKGHFRSEGAMIMSVKVPKSPDHAGPAGRRLWRDVLSQWELGEADVLLLEQAVRVIDRCQLLGELLRRSPPVITGRLGQVLPNPLAAELRSERRVLLGFLAALGLTSDAPEQVPARRGELAVVRDLRRGAG